MRVLGKRLASRAAGRAEVVLRGVALGLVAIAIGVGGPVTAEAGALRQAAAVESDSGPKRPRGGAAPLVELPDDVLDSADTGMIDLEGLLVSAGFDDVILMSGEDLESIGSHFSAGWVAPAGDLIGLLFFVPADEPKSIIDTFLGDLGVNCDGRFVIAPDELEILDDRMIARARAACEAGGSALHYDLVFYFTLEGTLGIAHIAFDATLQRARKINGGLVDIFHGW